MPRVQGMCGPMAPAMPGGAASAAGRGGHHRGFSVTQATRGWSGSRLAKGPGVSAARVPYTAWADPR